MAVKLLLAGFNKYELEQLTDFANSQKIENIIIINKNDEEKIVGDLVKEANIEINEILEEKLILFYGMTNKQITKFIDGYKKNKLDKPLFAVVTPHSIKWELKTLLKHLNEERKQMLKK